MNRLGSHIDTVTIHITCILEVLGKGFLIDRRKGLSRLRQPTLVLNPNMIMEGVTKTFKKNVDIKESRNCEINIYIYIYIYSDGKMPMWMTWSVNCIYAIIPHPVGGINIKGVVAHPTKKMVKTREGLFHRKGHLFINDLSPRCHPKLD